MTGWHRKPHIHQVPFYYIEYGLASLGAFQIWENAQKDQAKALRDYRRWAERFLFQSFIVLLERIFRLIQKPWAQQSN